MLSSYEFNPKNCVKSSPQTWWQFGGMEELWFALDSKLLSGCQTLMRHIAFSRHTESGLPAAWPSSCFPQLYPLSLRNLNGSYLAVSVHLNDYIVHVLTPANAQESQSIGYLIISICSFPYLLIRRELWAEVIPSETYFVCAETIPGLCPLTSQKYRNDK